jgi:glycosyltransferase involved in cell wall biosynthesis
MGWNVVYLYVNVNVLCRGALLLSDASWGNDFRVRRHRPKEGYHVRMTQPLPSVSIAMSVYNDGPYLAQAVQSVLAQTHADFEFLIVDDGSTDGSGALIDDFAARDPRILPIHQENRGLVASLNRMLRESRAPLVARMDGDDDCHPERLARQVAFMASHPDHGAVGTQSLSFDDAGRRWPSPTWYPTDHAQVAADERNSPLICHPSVMMRRDLVLEVGGYRQQFRHCEDHDLWLRLVERARLASLPERLTYYRRSPGQISNRHAATQAIGAAMAWQAHLERVAGRADPFDGLEVLPPVADLDRLFGREGVARDVRDMVLPQLIYTREGLTDEVFGMALCQVRERGGSAQAWRLLGRLLKFGQPARAMQLARQLVLR